MLHILQTHHMVSEEFQCPALTPIWSLATRQVNQLGLALAIQTATLGTFSWKASGEGDFHILLDKPLFDANDRATIDVQHLSNLPVGVVGLSLTLIAHQQDSRHQIVFGWSTAHMHHCFQPSVLLPI